MKFYGLRAKINRQLTVLFGRVSRWIPLSPNQWTMASLIPALAAIWTLAHDFWITSAILLVVSLILDAIDGAVARTTGKVTTFGGYLDALVDRYSEAAFMIGLMLTDLPDVWLSADFWIFFYFFGSLMTAYAKAAAKEKDYVKEEVGGGIAGRCEKFIILGLGMIAAAFDPEYMVYVLIAIGVLSHITVFQRIKIATRVHAAMEATQAGTTRNPPEPGE